MAKSGYAITTGGQSAVTSTPACALGVKGNAAFGVDLKGFWVDFDGVTSSNVPALVELGAVTFATNSPGTNSTSVTPTQLYGRLLTHGFTAAKTWTTEPTVITVLDAFALDPNKGLFRYDWPLGETPDSALAEGFVLRITATNNVNIRAGMRFERA